MLHSCFPQVEDCRIESVAHLLHMQRPEPAARGIAEFFARHLMAEAERQPEAISSRRGLSEIGAS
jgi:hypothetical protein